MRIVHIITGLGAGGAEAVLYRLTTGDKDNCHQVISLTDGGAYAMRLVDAGIPVSVLDMSRRGVTVKGIIKLYRLIRSARPALVQTWMYHADLLGGIVSRIAGVKTIAWGIRGPFNRQRTSYSTTITIRLCALLSWWLPKVIISNSAHALNVHIKTGYAKNKFVNIPNGYPLEQFQPRETVKADLLIELGLLKDVLLIGMVARFDPYKDHANLLAALYRLISKGCRVICLLVGSAMEETNQTLIKQIEHYGVQNMVKLLGPRDDVHKIMAALDLHVLSSAAESFPNVLAEAMACGTPCVTTDVGDAGSIVGETGWIVPPSDSASLAKAIEEALIEAQDPSKWNARKMACRKQVIENYGLDRMIESYNKTWARALACGKDEQGLQPEQKYR